MEELVLEKLNRIEHLLSELVQDKNIKYAFINENSNELWNGHDICQFMQIPLSEFIIKIAPTPDFPIPVVKEDNCLSSKWRAGAVVIWIKNQENLKR